MKREIVNIDFAKVIETELPTEMIDKLIQIAEKQNKPLQQLLNDDLYEYIKEQLPE